MLLIVIMVIIFVHILSFFLPPDYVTKSLEFTPSQCFTKSNTFIERKTFTLDRTFTSDRTFTENIINIDSNTFTSSQTFTKSETFSERNYSKMSGRLAPKRKIQSARNWTPGVTDFIRRPMKLDEFVLNENIETIQKRYPKTSRVEKRSSREEMSAQDKYEVSKKAFENLQ